MAFTYTEAQTVSDLGFDDSIHVQVYDAYPFWKKLELNEQIESKGGGRAWTYPVRVKKLDKANAVGPRDKIDFIDKETRTLASVDPKYYVGTAVIPWDKNRENKGKAQLIDLIKDKSDELTEDFMHRLNTDLWTSNPNGNGITPLTTIVDSSTSTAFAGITPTDCDTGAWVGIEDGATTKLELYGGLYGTSATQSLSSMINAAKYGKGRVTMHLTTKELRSVFESILETHQIFNAKLGDKQMADAGFENVAFHGAGVFDDPYVPAGYWLGLNMDAFAIFKDPESYLEVTKWAPISNEYPKTMQKTMFAVLALKCESRRTNFKFTALDSTLV